ncbi:MAG TPA: hypothetical protein VGU71_00035 [Candidatus Dormibacteraeota bacterium]|nr:hypothetical protein [Candidatus Dormibacteraeota bacterium]
MSRRRLRQLVDAPNHRVDLSSQFFGETLELLAQCVPLHGAKDEEINVTPERIPAGGIGAEEERQMDIAHGFQAPAKLLRNAPSPANDVPHGWQQRAVLPHGPQSKVAQPSTLHKP